MKKITCILNTLCLYLIMIFPFFTFLASKVKFLDTIWEKVFNYNAYIPMGVLLGLVFITFILNIIFFIKSLKNKDDTSKSNMIVKLISIPAYIIIFITCIVCLMTIFTFIISFLLAIFSYICLIMTGLYAVSTYKKLKDKNVITKKEFIIFSILSFIYISDIIVSIIAYKKQKKIML
ncbi:MAG: hypothetical protein IKP98_00815 [Bacilli bacterium]|nr:hypothetical protein [Bacilli bacterium]